MQCRMISRTSCNNDVFSRFVFSISFCQTPSSHRTHTLDDWKANQFSSPYHLSKLTSICGVWWTAIDVDLVTINKIISREENSTSENYRLFSHRGRRECRGSLFIVDVIYEMCLIDCHSIRGSKYIFVSCFWFVFRPAIHIRKFTREIFSRTNTIRCEHNSLPCAVKQRPPRLNNKDDTDADSHWMSMRS